jgi:hypothetical protein
MVRLGRGLFAAAIVAALTPGHSAAQGAGGGRGFLFGEPHATLNLRLGYSHANAGSDLFDFTTEQLTLDRGDFSSVSFETDFAVRVASRTRLVLSFAVAGIDKRSEFRDFVDNEDLPIEQNTEFFRVPLTIGVRQYLTSPGRSIGRYAWIPARVAPYVGAGAGVMYYQFHQTGDFIDFETMEVFTSQYESSSWTGTANVVAGLDFSLSSRLALTTEGRYTFARATLSRDFSGFERIDLSGFALTGGLSVRF